MTKKHIKLGKISVPDVRSKKDVPALEKLLKKGPITFVLVYADWCGHCDRYKNNVWSPLKSMRNRTSNLASVHYDQLENTSLANAKIDGYPSMLVVGKDKTPATFNGNSGVTNAMPDANNLETMKKVVTAPVNTSVSTLNSKNTNTKTNLGDITNLNSLNISSTPPDVRTPMSQNGRLSPLLSASNVPIADETSSMNVASVKNAMNAMNSNAMNTNAMNTNAMNPNAMNSNAMNSNAMNSNAMNSMNTNAMNSMNSMNANPMNANAMNPMNTNAMNSNTMNANPMNANPTNTNVATSIPPNIESDVVENSTNRAINLNKPKTQSQGSTPLLEGGRLYKSLSYKKRKSSRLTKKRKQRKN